MLQNPHRSQPRAPRRLQDLGAGPIGAKKLAPHGPSSGISAKKLPQQATKRQFWGVLSVQGELFRAHAHIRPNRENFFAHKARQHGDVETTNTTARPQQGTAETGITSAHPQQGSLETGITSAPEKRDKNAHFAPAKAMAVSIPHRYKQAKATTVSIPHEHERAKAMTVSDKRPTWPTGPDCGTRGQYPLQTSSNQRDSHRLGRTPVTNVVNLSQKTAIFSSKALGLTTFVTTGQKATRKTPWIDDVCNNTHPSTPKTQHARPPHDAHRKRRVWLRCPWAVAGPGRASRRCTEQHQRPHPTGVEGAGGTGGHGRASRRGAERSEAA